MLTGRAIHFVRPEPGGAGAPVPWAVVPGCPGALDPDAPVPPCPRAPVPPCAGPWCAGALGPGAGPSGGNRARRLVGPQPPSQAR